MIVGKAFDLETISYEGKPIVVTYYDIKPSYDRVDGFGIDEVPFQRASVRGHPLAYYKRNHGRWHRLGQFESFSVENPFATYVWTIDPLGNVHQDVLVKIKL